MPLGVDLGFQPLAADVGLEPTGWGAKLPKRRGPCDGGFGICGTAEGVVRGMEGNISSSVWGGGVGTGPPKRGAPERCGIGGVGCWRDTLTVPFELSGGMCSHDMLALVSAALPLPFAPGPIELEREVERFIPRPWANCSSSSSRS